MPNLRLLKKLRNVLCAAYCTWLLEGQERGLKKGKSSKFNPGDDEQVKSSSEGLVAQWH